VTCHLLLTIRSVDGGTMGRYLDMSTAVSLALEVDGQSVLLSPEKDHLSDHATNSWSYPPSADILRNLADAHEIDVTLSNEGGTLIGFHGSRFFKQFLEECGKPTEQSDTPEQ
jgi:hypothetical protein